MAKNSKDVVGMLEDVFAKAPALPTNAKEVIVKIVPIVAIVFGILGVLGAISGLGILTVFSPIALFGGALGISSYGTGFIAAILWLISSLLMLAAYPGTKVRKLTGWNLLFWSEVVSLGGSLFAGSIVSGIIGAAIAFYILFQIKSYYK